MTAQPPYVLAHLSRPRVGGWISYTAHLAESLLSQARDVQIVRLAEHNEAKSRPYARGLTYRNVTAGTLAAVARSGKYRVVVASFDGSAPQHLLEVLAEQGVPFILHGSTDVGYVKDRLMPLRAAIVVRPALGKQLAGLGLTGYVVPQPYATPLQVPPGDGLRRVHAVAYSRLDWVKHTDLIVAANDLLPSDKHVTIYGAENRLFTHHSLPGHWRTYYAGAFDNHRAVDFTRAAKYAVDLTTIAHDGGGTQYTFLEAWAGGAALVVHRNWLLDGGEMQEGDNCLAVGSAADLVEVLQDNDYMLRERLRHAGFDRIHRHVPGRVVPVFEEACALVKEAVHA